MCHLLQLATKESSAFITEPPFNLPNVQDVYDQFMFEEYEFQSYFRCVRESYSLSELSSFRPSAVLLHLFK
jgi:actin-related protein